MKCNITIIHFRSFSNAWRTLPCTCSNGVKMVCSEPFTAASTKAMGSIFPFREYFHSEEPGVVPVAGFRARKSYKWKRCCAVFRSCFSIRSFCDGAACEKATRAFTFFLELINEFCRLPRTLWAGIFHNPAGGGG